MFRQTDDRKVWYEWMVEVFAVEQPHPATTTPTTTEGAGGNIPLMSGGNGHGNAAGREARHVRPNGGRRGRGRRVRVGMSDLHSSIKDGCLM